MRENNERWRGSGWGDLRRGRQAKLSDIKVGVVLLAESKPFHARNVVLVTHLDESGLKRDIFYGIFVHPENSGRTRSGYPFSMPIPAGALGEFAVWDHELPGKYYVARSQA